MPVEEHLARFRSDHAHGHAEGCGLGGGQVIDGVKRRPDGRPERLPFSRENGSKSPARDPIVEIRETSPPVGCRSDGSDSGLLLPSAGCSPTFCPHASGSRRPYIPERPACRCRQ